MKTKVINMKTKWLLAVPFAMLPILAFSAGIKSFSSEQDVVTADGQSYVQVEVTCQGISAPRVISRKASDGNWCGDEAEGFCEKSKIKAAQTVCSKKYARALDAMVEEVSEQAPVAVKAVEVEQKSVEVRPEAVSADALSADENAGAEVIEAAEVLPSTGSEANAETLENQEQKLAIEKERLRIEQQRLELRKQQVELQKQELEIKRQMEQEAKKAANAAPAKAAPAPKPVEPAPDPAQVKKSVLGM
jgi:hypothetical protein